MSAMKNRQIKLEHVLLVLFAALGACSSPSTEDADETPVCIGKCDAPDGEEVDEYEYIVVGSGAGGGPLAANLAREGHSVLLLEAGGDTGGRVNYQVPAFHTLSTEDSSMQWDYFVDHYGDASQAHQDNKFVTSSDPRHEGVLYPRSGAIGGCTAHNAMITVYPHESDWNGIRELTGDDSWHASQMRGYFERVERNRYLDNSDDLAGHGTTGWLQVERPSVWIGLRDAQIRRIILGSALEFVDDQDRNIFSQLWGDVGELVGVLRRDLNSAAPGRDQLEGLFQIPLATRDGRRNGTREYIVETTEGDHPLTVRTHALVTNVVFADEPGPSGQPRAVGVEFLSGRSLYGADPRSASATGRTCRPGDLDCPAPPERRRVMATREVILAAGAFNTPQLLMLSGIGPAAELERHGIDVRVDLPGVGGNLQDRYEVGIVSEMDDDFSALEGCTFGEGDDPCLDEWEDGEGVYTSNGGVISIVKRSSVAEDDPDLFIFGLPGNFRGYYPGYAADSIASHDRFTWVVLKAHTRNRGGTVRLRSSDPTDTPDINFRYFEEGTNDAGEADLDMQAMVEGVEFVRNVIGQHNGLTVFNDMNEVYPGDDVSSVSEISDFVRNESWGHHASCTAAIGADGDPMAVLNSRFQVRGVEGLRVVDASVFPEIPGFFIVTPIYMISEKATDVILEDAL